MILIIDRSAIEAESEDRIITKDLWLEGYFFQTSERRYIGTFNNPKVGNINCQIVKKPNSFKSFKFPLYKVISFTGSFIFWKNSRKKTTLKFGMWKKFLPRFNAAS